MTHETVMDKDRLAAFADGELTPEEAAAVVMHLADHPADQAYVDEVMAANAALIQAFDRPMREPVPPRLLATIRGEQAPTKVIAFPGRRLMAFGGMALAASLALGAVLVQTEPSVRVAVGPLTQKDALHDPLQRLPSGQTLGLSDGVDLTILASLPVTDGFCREAELIDRNADRLDMLLACKQGSGWTVVMTLSEVLPEDLSEQGFVPAGGSETQALTLWLDKMGAGMALDAEAEALAIGRDWAP